MFLANHPFNIVRLHHTSSWLTWQSRRLIKGATSSITLYGFIDHDLQCGFIRFRFQEFKNGLLENSDSYDFNNIFFCKLMLMVQIIDLYKVTTHRVPTGTNCVTLSNVQQICQNLTPRWTTDPTTGNCFSNGSHLPRAGLSLSWWQRATIQTCVCIGRVEYYNP